MSKDVTKEVRDLTNKLCKHVLRNNIQNKEIALNTGLLNPTITRLLSYSIGSTDVFLSVLEYLGMKLKVDGKSVYSASQARGLFSADNIKAFSVMTGVSYGACRYYFKNGTNLNIHTFFRMVINSNLKYEIV